MDGNSSKIKKLIIESLSKYEDPEVVNTLISYLQYEKDSISIYAINSLIKIGDYSIPKLLEAFDLERR